MPDVLDGRHPGRFPQGRRRGSVDRQRRPRVPRAVDVARRRNRRAVPVDACSPAPTARSGPGTGNEGKVLKIGKDGKVVDVLRRDRARSPRASSPAPNGGLYVAHLARRQDLPRERGRHGADLLRSRRQVHLGARARSRGQPLRRDRRQGRHLQDHARTARARASTRPAPPTSCRWPFAPTGDLLAGTESPGRVFRIDATGKAFVLLDSPFKEIHALRLADDGTLYAAAVSGADGGDRRSLAPTTRRRPGTSARADGLDRDHGDLGRRHRRVRRSRRRSISGASRPQQPRARSIASGRTACGTRYWETGEDSPYDLLVEPGGSLLVGTGTEGKIFRVTGDPARATLLVARHRAAGHGAPARTVRAHRRRHEQSRGSSSRCRRARRRRAATSPTCATPARWPAGARSAGARTARPGQVQIC